MDVSDYSNTPSSSGEACLSSLEIEVEKSGQKAFLKQRSVAEELVKLCSGINVKNITSKVESLKKYLEKHDESCRRWLAQHCVLRWIPLEKKTQFMYYNFFKILNDVELNKHIKQETFRNINILLKNKSKRETSDIGERIILRNYGHWLGLITITSNVPILHDELDLAGLLLYAYTTGEQELFHIAPFIAEVILASTRSHVFKSTCSWLNPIYRLFAGLLQSLLDGFQDYVDTQSQLHSYPQLSQVNQQIAEITAILGVIEAENNKHENENETPVVTVRFPSFNPPSHVVQTIEFQPIPPPQFYFHEVNLFEDYNSRIIIPTHHSFFQIFPSLERQTRHIFVKIVTENMEEISQRSLMLSVPLSVELIKTHLSQFNDETDLRTTALTTVRSLTSAVALHNSRELLTKTLTDAIRKLFDQYIQQYENPRQTFLDMADETIKTILEQNLEYAVCYVIKTACNQGMKEIDHIIKGQLQADGNEENVLPKVQEMLDKLPPELSRNLTAEELCNIFPNHLFGFKQAPKLGEDKRATTEASKSKADKSRPDPAILRKKLESVFHDWISLCYADNRPVIRDLLPLIHKQGVAFQEETVCKLIKVSLKVCTEASYTLLAQNETPEVAASTRRLCYFTIDCFIKLTCVIIKNGHTTVGVSNFKLLQKVLEAVSHALVTDHDIRQTDFNGLPFLRILITLIEELIVPKTDDSDKLNTKLKDIFKQVLLYIQPRRAPAFAFHWLEIIGHRKFISLYLAAAPTLLPSSVAYEQLLVNLLKFLAPSFRICTLSNGVKKLYQGTLRLMTVLLHDFPDFFCEYYFTFCDAIPSTCIQLRNIVLCAFPSKMKPPDPFSLHFNKLQAIPEMSDVPTLSTQMFSYIPADARQLVTFYTDEPQESVMSEIARVFKMTSPNGDDEYNVPLLNAFVSFVGFRAASHFKEIKEVISISVVSQHVSVNIFQNLALSFCPEGNYLLFNALINQLRYPSALTHYFACTILFLFKELNDLLKEQIIHIFFERVAALRPHPWGLYITFIELIKNEQYDFWGYDYIHRYPDIRNLLVNIARKCNAKVPPEYLEQ